MGPMPRPSTEFDAATEAGETALPDAGLARCFLVVVGADGSTRTLELTNGEVTIGRDPTATVRVDEPRVSRLHARVFRRAGAVILEDLGSRNGTRIDDAELKNARQELSGGSRIAIGSVEVLVAMVRAMPRGTNLGASAGDHGPSVVIADPEMQRVMSVARRLGQTPTTCLILGETGVGKDVVARTIHAESMRASAPFVRFNCAATPQGLMESELFGHERGAFTGADRRRTGYVEAAAGGTLFLDEVGELPLALQAKLLHFLEHHTITRVGSTQELRVDVRILAATHRALEQEARAGRFREDLYYRLAAFTLVVPPLRERKSEVPLLAEFFAVEFAQRFGRATPRIAESTAHVLSAHTWPGNVRELKNAIEHAFVLADETISPEHLPQAITQGVAPLQAARGSGALDHQLSAVERANIVAALEAENNNRTRAAKRLGISRRALIYKLHKHGLS